VLDNNPGHVRADGVRSEYFEVDAGSGVLYTARQLDRDVVCRGEDVCRLTLDVALLRPVSLFRVLQVHVDLLDLNDNDPQFRVDDFRLTIPESVSPGKQLATVMASTARFAAAVFVVQSYSPGGAYMYSI